MPEFMVMIHEDEAVEGALTPAATQALVEGHAAYERKLRDAAAYRDGERLRPSSEGRRVNRRDGQIGVEPGPFGDKALAGYYVVEAAGRDDAVKLAEDCPLPPGGELDVRPLMKSNLQSQKTAQQGRVFAFGVLGNAPTEQAWTLVMDRIDESSRGGFPSRERFLGGVRLEAPGRGRHVAATGGRRAVFDGPFLESKEVIGGLFFMRMTSLEEAVEWASKTVFVDYGALEIRELWRS
jgi:hypothetical protein